MIKSAEATRACVQFGVDHGAEGKSVIRHGDVTRIVWWNVDLARADALGIIAACDEADRRNATREEA